MFDVVRRVPPGRVPGGVELSEARLQELIDAMHATADAALDDAPGGGRRRAARLPVEGFALMARDQDDAAVTGGSGAPDTPGSPAPPHFVGVYDISRAGIAIVDAEPLAAGDRFRVLVPRDGDRRPIEVRCVVRHCRQQGDGYIIGAAFGTSWVAALGARVVPVG